MKKYNQFIKESNTKFLAAMADEDLEERLSFLRLQLSELQEEILTIVNIQKDRKNRENTEYAKTLPASIYDFNEEQLNFIFQGDLAQINNMKYKENIMLSYKEYSLL